MRLVPIFNSSTSVILSFPELMLIIYSGQELLALGERIGNVNTGLSEDTVFKHLTEKAYCSGDQNYDEQCTICLVRIICICFALSIFQTLLFLW